ncbi:MAG TPA: helix-turn-helix transcriptional regulator [Candidatus Saccharimonadales bacterium]|nr:helix-turn-helix transcriptional regulator [Candidatus Saccharimonadales bacterium]
MPMTIDPPAETPLEVHGRTSGELMRELRKQRHLVLRDVTEATRRIAEAQNNEEYAISPGRLSEVENKGVVPGIFRLYALSVVYQVELRELLSYFGIPRE